MEAAAALEVGMEVLQVVALLEVEMEERTARRAVSAAGVVALALGLCHT